MQIKTTVRYHYTPIRMAKIQNPDTTKCWQGCGATRTLIHCWWECKMVKPPWKTVWKFLTKLNILLPYNWTLYYSSKGAENLCPHKNLHINVYSSFIHNYQNLEVPRCPTVSEWINKLVYLHNGMLFSTKKKWTIKLWKDMENCKCILLRERNQSEKAM